MSETVADWSATPDGDVDSTVEFVFRAGTGRRVAGI
jgi:hypothetical protein